MAVWDGGWSSDLRLRRDESDADADCGETEKRWAGRGDRDRRGMEGVWRVYAQSRSSEYRLKREVK